MLCFIYGMVQSKRSLLKRIWILTRVTEMLKINNNAIVNKLMLFSCLKHSYLKTKKTHLIFWAQI